jgi:hypothetical protein
MVNRLQQNIGKYPFVTLAAVKDYLSISSTTQDGRVANILHYATGMVESYIGQEVLANDYVEIFDGGVSSVMVSRLPLSNVHLVSEFDGSNDVILSDPSSIGRPVNSESDDLTMSSSGGAQLTTKVTRFGASCLHLVSSDAKVESETIPEDMQFEFGDYTLEAFVRQDSIGSNTIIQLKTDTNNHLKFKFQGDNGLRLEQTIGGATTTISGDNTSIKTQQFGAREFAHVAACFDNQEQRARLFYNGNLISNAAFAISNSTQTASAIIGDGLTGFMDEVRVSTNARYRTDFTCPAQRFAPDKDTVALLHFDGPNKATDINDSHNDTAEYVFSRDMGEINRDVGNTGVRGSYPTTRNSYPALTMTGPAMFKPYPQGIRVEYRGGYESDNVPYDLQMATLDTIKLIYKQDQEKKGFSLEGERSEKYPLAAGFPAHIKRILDLYRIIE